MLKVIQTGDSWNSKPGTSDQTGNRAPKYPWSASPIGRTARIVALCCAYHLGYNDDTMAKLHRFPPAQDIYDIFLKVMPWFAFHYDLVRISKAMRSGYKGPLEKFNEGDVENRVRYCFAVPGRKGHDPKARLYGISVEHPLSTAQRGPNGRGAVFARCSEEIFYRLRLDKSISIEEATMWGQKEEEQI